MSGTEDTQPGGADTPPDATPEAPETRRSARTDRLAIERKWQERWAAAPVPSPLDDVGDGEDRSSTSTPPYAAEAAVAADPDSGADEPTWGEGSDDGPEDGERDPSARRRPQEPPEDRDDDDPGRPFYCLDMFPYPSTHGFSVNQLRGFATTDVVARYQRARGRTIFRPIGWDSFGVGIEQEAESLGLPPHEVVERGIETMRDQLARFGILHDRTAEIRTSDPAYYRWTQWLFLRLREKELAVRHEVPMKWCGECRMNLANEEVVDGGCVHCDRPVEERAIPQWTVRITDYADRLHQGLRSLKWPPRVKALQRNWIGRSDGFAVILKARNEFREELEEFEVFTRRLESLGDCTFVVLSPEHPLIDEVTDELYRDEVAEYRERARRRTERERLATQGQPEGVPTGAWALNPVTLRPMPIWVSAGVVPSIRLGAVLGNPSTDARQRDFAEHFRIPQRGGETDGRGRRRRRRRGRRGRPGQESGGGDVRRRVRSSLEARGLVEARTDFHLRDWVFARQRYWGEPIPIVHCAECGEVPVPEADLPVELPLLDATPPAEGGESPLARIDSFVETVCPTCGGPAKRETDTMPQWAASGWYYLRYLSPNDAERIFDPEVGRRWLPVNLCVGGIEHAILHLLYVRFFSYFVHDLGLTDREEPFRRLFNQGRIHVSGDLPVDGPRSATHRGRRILAGDILDRWGADVLRLHLLFLGPPSSDVEWDEHGLRGCARFLDRAHRMIRTRRNVGRFVSRRALVLKHRLIRRVTRAIRTFHLNKAVSAFMEFVKEMRAPDLSPEEVDHQVLRTFVVLLQPFAPHLAAELWSDLGETTPLDQEPWPEYSEELLRPLEVEIAVLVDGRIIDRLTIDPSLGKTEVLQQIEERPKVISRTEGRRADRVVYVPERLVHLIYGVPGAEGAPAGSGPEGGNGPGPGDGPDDSPEQPSGHRGEGGGERAPGQPVEAGQGQDEA